MSTEVADIIRMKSKAFINDLITTKKISVRLILLVSFVAIFLLCFSFFLYEICCYNLVSKKELEIVREKLQNLSPQEKKDLAVFFNYANLFCQYPYTLVGYKPMSICNFLQASKDLPKVLRKDYERPKHRAFADTLERGHRAWERYQYLFPLKKCLLIRYHASNSKGMNEIALVHPKLCLAKIEEHLDDFCQILQKSYQPEEIFEILTNPKHEKFYCITQQDRLLGILLGFGRNNAYLFEQNRHEKLKFFTNEWPGWPRKWRLPGFVSDPTTVETKHLKKLYKEARKFIRWTYFNRADLEVTLALLAQEQ